MTKLKRIVIINTSEAEKIAEKNAENRIEILGAKQLPTGSKVRGFSKQFQARSGRMKTFKFDKKSEMFQNRIASLKAKIAERENPVL